MQSSSIFYTISFYIQRHGKCTWHYWNNEVNPSFGPTKLKITLTMSWLNVHEIGGNVGNFQFDSSPTVSFCGYTLRWVPKVFSLIFRGNGLEPGLDTYMSLLTAYSEAGDVENIRKVWILWSSSWFSQKVRHLYHNNFPFLLIYQSKNFQDVNILFPNHSLQWMHLLFLWSAMGSFVSFHCPSCE